MKHDRPGDWLWNEWDGEGYEPRDSSAIIYVTNGEVDTTEDLVRRALASALQRDGIAQSLGHGFKMVDAATIVQGFSGIVQDDEMLFACDEFGLTEFGDRVEEKVLTTWMEVPYID